jgi:6-phosphofructokinase
MIDGELKPLGFAEISGILPRGGTIIGTSRTNPHKLEGGVEGVQRAFEQMDGLIAIGGEDTLGVASKLHSELDLPVVGVPKTIDNDLNGTDYTFGFDTAVAIATEAIDRVHTTAESHNRIIVVETMGRHAGWIALMSGIAGGADFILIPEQPVVWDDVAAAVERRRSRGKNFSVIVASEGCELPGVADEGEVDDFGHVRVENRNIGEAVATEAIDRVHTTAESHNRIIVVETMGRHAGWIALMSGIAGGADFILIPEQPVVWDDVAAAVERRRSRGKNFSVIVASEGCELPGVADEGEVDDFGHVRVENRNIGEAVATEVEARTGMQTRATVLGYIQRGGSPTARDRVLGLRFGLKAADLVVEGSFGQMAALRGDEILSVPLSEATAELKLVPDSWYQVAQTFFG